ncbi:MAG: hypothetical protein PX634_17125, partial [Microcystis sp. M53600_WE12]|nr:hypothetical protein [Microcystis sp. M53600_WE12]
PNFQGKSPGIFHPITPGSGTFWKPKSLKVLPNKVFRFIQQTLNSWAKNQEKQQKNVVPPLTNSQN